MHGATGATDTSLGRDPSIERCVIEKQPTNRVHHWVGSTFKGVVQPVEGHRFVMYIIFSRKRDNSSARKEIPRQTDEILVIQSHGDDCFRSTYNLSLSFSLSRAPSTCRLRQKACMPACLPAVLSRAAERTPKS